MEVDSPQFFKKLVDDWGGDNQSCKYHYPSEADMWMASLNEFDAEESVHEDNDDAKPDLLEDSTQANLTYLKGKFVRKRSEFHIQAPSDDEVYSLSHATLPVPTSQSYKWQNADGDDVMPYNNLPHSSGSSAYRLPLEKELSGGIARGRLSLSAANSSTRHAPEPSTQPHETNFRNPLSLEDSLEPRDAAGDRDDVMSGAAFVTEYGASISDLFSDRGTNLFADKDLPLAHGQSAGANGHPSKQATHSRRRSNRSVSAPLWQAMRPSTYQRHKSSLSSESLPSSKFNIQAPSDDEFHSMPSVISPPPRPRKQFAKVLPSQQLTPHRSNNPA